MDTIDLLPLIGSGAAVVGAAVTTAIGAGSLKPVLELATITVAAASAVASMVSAKATRATVQEMNQQRLSETRPDLHLGVSGMTLTAVLSNTRFEVNDSDGVPVALVLDNVGRGRGYGIDLRCTLEDGPVPQGVPVILGEAVDGGSLEAIRSPLDVALGWAAPDGPLLFNAWRVSSMFENAVADLDVRGQATVEIPKTVLLAWAHATVATAGPVDMHCTAIYSSVTGEEGRTVARLRLTPRMRVVENGELRVRLRLETVRTQSRTIAPDLELASRQARERRKYVAAARQRLNGVAAKAERLGRNG